MKNNFKYQEFEIFDKRELAFGIFLFRFNGRINFKPGQFVQARIPRIGEATFAPCSSPFEKKSFELCVRAIGNTTNAFSKLLPGQKILLRGPFGNGWPEGNLIDKNIVLISGGLGIVPMRSLLFKLTKYRREIKSISLLSGFKTPDQLLFKDDFDNWKKSLDYIRVSVEKNDRDWWGDVGLLPEIIRKLKINRDNSKILICGPEPMLKFCLVELDNKKIDHKNIYFSFERRMECGIGICQHCNIGRFLVCKDGPIFRIDKIEKELDL